MQNSKILLVDDRPENLTALEKILKPLQVTILKADSGEKALSLVIHHRFAVILLDVQMPGMDGFETAKLIHQSEEGAHIPIIFITAINKDECYILKGYETGAVDYLPKPINSFQIKGKVKVFIELDQQRLKLKALIKKKEELLQTVTAVSNENEKNIKQNAKLKIQSKLWIIVAFLAILCAGFLFYNFRISEENTRLEDTNEQIMKLNKAYERFIPNEFVTLLGKDGIENVDLGDQILQAMTVMFFDVVGFTAASEHMTTKEVITVMNEVFAIVQKAVTKNYGIINKFLGDGAMIIFPRNENDAVMAAIEMNNAIAFWNEKRKQNGLKPLHIGIGIDSGPLMAGTVGEEKRMEFTAYGRVVNLASRIEALTRKYNTHILITENVYSRLIGKNRANIRVVDNIKVKGKIGSVTIYDVFESKDSKLITAHQKTLPNYLKGFHFYQNGQLQKAIIAFKKVLLTNKNDSLAKYHLQKCQQLIKNNVLSKPSP